MARLYLFAEGQTEQTFASTVLQPHLANQGVLLHNPVLIAHSRKKGKVHRGGGRNFIAMQNDIKRFLKQESGSGVFFTTMIDLYALHKSFPGTQEADRLRSDPYKRVECLETAWSDSIGDPRFIPFIQLHEYEAMLFAKVEELAFFYDNAETKVKALMEIITGGGSPELIDDGPQTAPSKRIVSQFPEYEDTKTTVGVQAAERIGLEVIRSKCPHFNGWIKQLENLAS